MNEIIIHNIFHSPPTGGRICGGDQGWLEGRLRGGDEGGGADRAGDGGEGGAREDPGDGLEEGDQAVRDVEADLAHRGHQHEEGPQRRGQGAKYT